MEIIDPLTNVADPTVKLVLQYAAGGCILGLAAFMVWYDKIDKGIMLTLLLAAAAAVGMNVSQ